ncbi:MAG: hypothetical protein ACRCSF_10070 [Mycobacteriaceae bacterium]
MKFTKISAISALVIGAMSIAAGTANAAPGELSNDQATINYSVSQVNDAAVITIDSGSFAAEDQKLLIRDNAGIVVDGVPLSYEYNGISYPVTAEIHGDSATLTPVTDPAAGTSTGAAVPVIHQDDLPAAVSAVKDQISLAATVGTIIGTVIAGGLGCLLATGVTVIPAILGGTAISLPTGLLSGPLAAILTPIIAVAGPIAIIGAACAVGAITFAPLGAITGVILVGLPAVIASAPQFIDVLQRPAVVK